MQITLRTIGIVVVCILPVRLSAGPEEANNVRAWCAPFLSVEGVDVRWRYDMVSAADGATVEPYRERVVCCWDSGILIEGGGGIGRRPDDGKGEAEFGYQAQVTVTSPERDRTTVSWTPGHDVSPALNREPVEYSAERVMRIFLSEYLIANYLVSEISASQLESAMRVETDGRTTITLSTPQYDFVWREGADGLQFAAVVSKTPSGDTAFRQEFDRYINEPTLGGMIASERRMFVPGGDPNQPLQHVNTAVLEKVSFLAEEPPGFAELDTSAARVADLASGIVYNDQGEEVGKLVVPTSPGQAMNWSVLLLLAGSGLAVGGAAWWWMRRRGQ